MPFFSELDWAALIVSIIKAASKKMGVLIHSVMFLSTEIVFCIYKPIL